MGRNSSLYDPRFTMEHVVAVIWFHRRIPLNYLGVKILLENIHQNGVLVVYSALKLYLTLRGLKNFLNVIFYQIQSV